MTARFRWAEGPGDVERCLDLRRRMFVAERGVALEEELDGLDGARRHALAERDGCPIGTARIRAAGRLARIERVAVARDERGAGVGRGLMRWLLDELMAEGWEGATLGAQAAALGFYERLGFEAEGPAFLDAGIPHRTMRLRLAAPGTAD